MPFAAGSVDGAKGGRMKTEVKRARAVCPVISAACILITGAASAQVTVLPSGRLMPSNTGLDTLDDRPVFPIGLSGADGWSAPFDNPWTICSTGDGSNDQYDCRLSPQDASNHLGASAAGLTQSAGQNCIPSTLYHAQMAQQLEPRLGSWGPFNVTSSRRGGFEWFGGGEERHNQEIWERDYWGYDARCAVYKGEGPGYDATGGCPWDSNGHWEPSTFDPNQDYLGLEPGNAGTCGENPWTHDRRLTVEQMVIGQISHRGRNLDAGFPGRMAYDPAQVYETQQALLSVNWIGDAHAPFCAVPYRSTIVRDPTLPVGPTTCSQCMFSDWSDPLACQNCLALTPSGQTALDGLTAGDFPLDVTTALANLQTAVTYTLDNDTWAAEMPPTILDCRTRGDSQPVTAYSHVDDNNACSATGDQDHGCATAAHDDDLCSRLVPKSGRNCVNLLHLDFTAAVGDLTPVATWCPDEYGFAPSGLNYRWYARPECPLHATAVPGVAPNLLPVGSGDAQGALLDYPLDSSGSPPWTNDVDYFYSAGWFEGPGQACLFPGNEPTPVVACHAEHIASAPYDLDGDGAPNESLSNVIGFAQPDEMGQHATRHPDASYLTPTLRFSPWMHESCYGSKPPPSTAVNWQEMELCQSEGRTFASAHQAELGRLYSKDEKAWATWQRLLVEDQFDGDPLVFADNEDFTLLADSLQPLQNAPANAGNSYTYPFTRLTSGTTGSPYAQQYFRPLTFTRDKMRAHHEFSVTLAQDPGAGRDAYPIWWHGQVIGEPAFDPLARDWNDTSRDFDPTNPLHVDGTQAVNGSELDRAKPMLEQMRVEAWTAIAEGLDGVFWYQDICPGGHCATIDLGWEYLAESVPPPTKPVPMTLGEQLLEVAAELRVHRRAFRGTLVEYDLSDDGTLDPWELDRNGPFLSYDSNDPNHWPYAPGDLQPKPAWNPGEPMGINGLDTDGDSLVDEGRKQDASAAVFDNPPFVPWLPPLNDRYVVATNLAECTKYVAPDDPVTAGMPQAPGGFDLVLNPVNSGAVSGTDADWNSPCEDNADIDASSPGDVLWGSSQNYFFGPDNDWKSWQASGGLFTGISNDVVLSSQVLQPGLLHCRSLTDEDLQETANLTPFLWPGGGWQTLSVWGSPSGEQLVYFTGTDGLAPYDVVICYQSDSNGQTWAPWSDVMPTPLSEQTAHLGWAAPDWAKADPTVADSGADAELVPMCDRPEGVGVEPCNGTVWEWTKPSMEHPSFGLCTGCVDEYGQAPGPGVDRATDSWIWLPEPGSTYPEYDLSSVDSGTLCLATVSEFEPGWDSVSGATVYDLASVEVSSANGCHILGHGGANSPCTEPLVTLTEWSRQDAGGAGPEMTAIDLTHYLGMPISIAFRYQAWEDGVRTDGPGWTVEGAMVQWFEDDSKTCEELLGMN